MRSFRPKPFQSPRMRLPVAREFIPVHLYASEIVSRMASRKGIEPLTPGLGNLNGLLLNSLEHATIAGNCWSSRAREEREQRGP